MFVGRTPAGERKGGTATYIRKASKNIEPIGTQTAELNGRMMAVPVNILGHKTRLVNLYLDSKPAGRRGNISRIRTQELTQRTDIIAGDFNCVEDVNMDVTHQWYANIGGSELAALFAQRGASTYARYS